MRPGFDVELRDAPVPRSGPVDTSTGFMVGPAAMGPVTQQILTSPDQYGKLFGGTGANLFLPDAVETAFAEGITRLYIKRIVGEDAEVSTHTFMDTAGAPVATLAVDASSPGVWGDKLKPAITVSGGTFTITVTHADTLKVLTGGGPFATKAAAVAAFEKDQYIRVRSIGGSVLNPAAAAAVALSGGDDDAAGLTDDVWEAGGNDFTKLLGPGQVAFPGRTTPEAHAIVLEHAATHNRRAILDAPNDPTASVLIAASEAQRDTIYSRFGAMFGPWDEIPGLFPNTTRVVPPCARIMGTIARVDREFGHPGRPAAGTPEGVAQYVTGLTQSYTDDEYTLLNENGVNMSREVFGNDVQVYGFRTLVDPITDPRWVEFNGSRVVMYVTSQANAIMATFAFDPIDGEGHLFSQLGGALTGMLLPLWSPPNRALYGATSSEAFRVETGPTVNTPERVQNREVRAVIGLRTSPFAEYIVTEIVRRMATEVVG